MRLSLDDIQDWKQFEELVKHYFDGMKQQDENEKENDVITSFVDPSGEGPDGGRDLLVTLRCNDSVIEYDRIWVVQCKFYTESVSPKHLSQTNIMGLLHQYNANGYLLVCKNGPTSGTTNMFTKLKESHHSKCFEFCFEIWTGEDLIKLIKDRKDLLKHYFTEYWHLTK